MINTNKSILAFVLHKKGPTISLFPIIPDNDPPTFQLRPHTVLSSHNCGQPQSGYLERGLVAHNQTPVPTFVLAPTSPPTPTPAPSPAPWCVHSLPQQWLLTARRNAACAKATGQSHTRPCTHKPCISPLSPTQIKHLLTLTFLSGRGDGCCSSSCPATPVYGRCRRKVHHHDLI